MDDTDPIRARLDAIDGVFPLPYIESCRMHTALRAVLDLCEDMDQQDINAVRVAAFLIRRVIAEHLGVTDES